MAKLSTKERLGMIAWVTSETTNQKCLGRTSMQKAVYIMQELSHKDFGYNYSLYNYGPFCKELAADLDIADQFSVLNVDYIREENRYEIKLGEGSTDFIEGFRSKMNEEIIQLDKAKSFCFNKSSRQLELDATILFLHRNDDTSSDDSIISKLLEIKPKYTEAEARSSLKSIKEVA